MRASPRWARRCLAVEGGLEELLRGTPSHGRIPDAGPLGSERRGPGAGRLRSTGGGDGVGDVARPLRARTHTGARRGRSGDCSSDPAGRVGRASTPWSTSTALGQVELRTDAAALGGELLGVGLVEATIGVRGVLAKRAPGGGAWSYVAEGLIPAPGPLVAVTNLGLVRRRRRVGVFALMADPDARRAERTSSASAGTARSSPRSENPSPPLRSRRAPRGPARPPTAPARRASRSSTSPAQRPRAPSSPARGTRPWCRSRGPGSAVGVAETDRAHHQQRRGAGHPRVAVPRRLPGRQRLEHSERRRDPGRPRALLASSAPRSTPSPPPPAPRPERAGDSRRRAATRRPRSSTAR